MKNQKIWIIACVCVLLAATVGVGLYVRSSQAEKELENAITLKLGDKSIAVALSDLGKVDFEGEIVDGKGDHHAHTYRGIELKELLEANGIKAAEITEVTAESADQYTAVLTGDEIREDARVYVVIEMDGKPVSGIEDGTPGAQLVVFGDPNSRRNVRFLSLITVK